MKHCVRLLENGSTYYEESFESMAEAEMMYYVFLKRLDRVGILQNKQVIIQNFTIGKQRNILPEDPYQLTLSKIDHTETEKIMKEFSAKEFI